MSQEQMVTILLAEDDAGHARLVEKNLRRAGIVNPIVNVENGQLAVDYLFGTGPGGTGVAVIPRLVLLDLNMPVMDGYQVLERIKGDDRTRHIPVVVLTTTDDSREIQRCYDLGCNVYITKPVDYDQFSDAVRRLGLFLSVVQIPT